MTIKSPLARGHTGVTGKGNTRDTKVERVGRVTIYKRGLSYSLYYRENGKTVRRAVDGNLATARATAHKVAAALEEHRPTPLGYERVSPSQFVSAFLDYTTHVQKLALRTQDRYRAALDRFKEFAADANIAFIDAVADTTVEDFVRWLRGQRRPRNGMRTERARLAPYKTGGIKFILSTCRTAFHWAARRRMLPPYAANPFARFGIDRLKSEDDAPEARAIFTPEQEQAFFAACDDWQRPIYTTLAAYGMRIGELNHLLIEDMDFSSGVIYIRSKPEMLWSIKTRRRRDLPLTSEMATLFQRVIGRRKAGFVFLNDAYLRGKRKDVKTFPSDPAFRAHLQTIQDSVTRANPAATERDRLRAVRDFCRKMGQITERRLLEEFRKVTRAIACPHLTRVHDLRHLFATRAQERGINPFLVQAITGHESLSMLGRYTHLGANAQRSAMQAILSTLPGLGGIDDETPKQI
jgi:site-specific recombinase XerD